MRVIAKKLHMTLVGNVSEEGLTYSEKSEALMSVECDRKVVRNVSLRRGGMEGEAYSANI